MNRFDSYYFGFLLLLYAFDKSDSIVASPMRIDMKHNEMIKRVDEIIMREDLKKLVIS
jgi:hypothetical protein